VTLDPALTEAVLDRLGLADRPAPDRAGLDRVYAAWCEHVTFDNLVKRIHLASGSAEPIPNGPADAFFSRWLRDGTSGTCWPSSGGLHALLGELGFDARRGSGAMRDDLSGPIHTHGTVIVTVDDDEYWVDTSMLTQRVLPLERGAETTLDDPVHQARVEPVDGGLWRVWWTHPFLDEMLGCLLLADDVTADHYLARYEASRDLSPFNTGVYATRSGPDVRVTVAFGQRWERTAAGITSTAVGDDRDRVLVEEFGYSEAIVAQLPPDDPPKPRTYERA
jgi:N-hydroxyarylamine O-acetyltransferase